MLQSSIVLKYFEYFWPDLQTILIYVCVSVWHGNTDCGMCVCVCKGKWVHVSVHMAGLSSSSALYKPRLVFIVKLMIG